MLRYSLLCCSFLFCLVTFTSISCQQRKKISIDPPADSLSSASHSTSSGNDAAEESSQAVYHLTPQLKRGDVYYYTINNDIAMDFEVNGQKTANSTTSTIGLLYRVVSDSGSQYTIQVTYKKMITQNRKGDVTEELNADNGDSFNATEKLLAGLKDQSVYLILTKKGQLLSVKGYNEMAANAVSRLGIEDEEQRKALQNQLSGMLGESFLKSNLVQNETLFPARSIQEGDEWTETTSDSLPFPVSGVSHCRLEEVEDGVADISVSSDLKSNSQSAGFMNMQVTSNVKGNSEASYKINVITGMLADEKIKSNLEGTIQVMGREVPINIVINKEVVVKKMEN